MYQGDASGNDLPGLINSENFVACFALVVKVTVVTDKGKGILYSTSTSSLSVLRRHVTETWNKAPHDSTCEV